MSFDFNYRLWISTKKDIEHIIRRQNILKKRDPIEKPVITFRIISQMYVLYVDLVHKLGKLLQNTFQVQKRDCIRNLLEAAAARLLGLKNELKNIEMSEFVYIDSALVERKLTPHDILIWRSPEFLYHRPPDIQNTFYNNQLFVNDDGKQAVTALKKQQITEAAILIQAHERARSARVYRSSIKYDRNNLKVRLSAQVNYVFTHKPDQQMSMPVKRTVFNANYFKSTPYCVELIKRNTLNLNELDEIALEQIQKLREEAATKIQTAWRAHKAKKLYKSRIVLKNDLYGMQKSRRLAHPNERTETILESYNKEFFKKKLDKDFIDLIASERTRLLQEKSPWIMEDISDHIRAWFHTFYEHFEAFHPYPDALKGGTVLVLTDETMDLLEFNKFLQNQNLSAQEKKNIAEKLKQQKLKEKEKLKKEKLKEAKQRKKMKDAGIYDIAYELSKNKNIQEIENVISRYSVDWKNIDEYLNRHHDAIKEWVTEGELAIIHKELRALVDEYMILEYEMLSKALAADQKKKYKAKKQKKRRSTRKKSKRRSNDITADRTIESLYNELVENGVVMKYPEQTFNNFIADFNYVANDSRDANNLVIMGPAKADIKGVIEESMLGMGVLNVSKPKSLCIVGPLRTGKNLLVTIIASELDALVLNISPEVTAKYIDNLNYFLHVVMKVAKAFQPTLLYIEDAHRVFWRKVPKEQEHLSPKLLQKVIAKKILKPIKNTDKIMLVGISDTPWAASKKFTKTFQKILLVPKSEYGSIFLLWLDLFTQNLPPFDVKDYMISALAKVFRTYNTGDIVENVEKALNIERRIQLYSHPLQPKELIDQFLEQPQPQFPPEQKFMEKYRTWFSKLNKYAKQRAAFLKKLARKNKKK